MTLTYIFKTIGSLNIMLSVYEGEKNKCFTIIIGQVHCDIFHGSVSLPYIFKTMMYEHHSLG